MCVCVCVQSVWHTRSKGFRAQVLPSLATETAAETGETEDGRTRREYNVVEEDPSTKWEVVSRVHCGYPRV